MNLSLPNFSGNAPQIPGVLSSPMKPAGPSRPEHQELKFTLHRKLVGKINLEALAAIDNQRVRAEVRQALMTLLDAEPTPLSASDKQQLAEEVLDEVFGLGPLEALLKTRPFRTSWSTRPARSMSSARDFWN
jgi:hypothetical protein